MGKVFLAVVSGVCISIVRPNNPLQTLVAFAGLGYVMTRYLVPRVGPSFVRIGLKGKDMSKAGDPEFIPESIGVVTAVTYLILMVMMIPFVFFKYLVNFGSMADQGRTSSDYSQQYTSVTNNRLFPHNKLAEYLSAVMCLQSTTLLGLFDDLFDIRWRHKFFLPAVASLPLLIVYYVDFSVTSVVIPGFVVNRVPGGLALLEVIRGVVEVVDGAVGYLTGLRFTTLEENYKFGDTVPRLLDLGLFYYVYMSAVSIFAPNSINILAGINGLEVGQSVVLALVFLVNDACYLLSSTVSQAAYESHLLSVIFLLPFLGVSMALLQFNWFPARVFVGDTYCYFSGMVFAIVGILGHFSKTLLLFFLPQILNFIYSAPQLFNIVPCPRHRLPQYNKKDGLMYPSFGVLQLPAKWQIYFVRTLSLFGILEVKKVPELPQSIAFSNMTLINLCLLWFGPLREDVLCLVLMALQFSAGMILIVVRHTLGPWLFGYDNLSWGVK